MYGYHAIYIQYFIVSASYNSYHKKIIVGMFIPLLFINLLKKLIYSLNPKTTSRISNHNNYSIRVKFGLTYTWDFYLVYLLLCFSNITAYNTCNTTWCTQRNINYLTLRIKSWSVLYNIGTIQKLRFFKTLHFNT